MLDQLLEVLLFLLFVAFLLFLIAAIGNLSIKNRFLTSDRNMYLFLIEASRFSATDSIMGSDDKNLIKNPYSEVILILASSDEKAIERVSKKLLEVYPEEEWGDYSILLSKIPKKEVLSLFD